MTIMDFSYKHKRDLSSFAQRSVAMAPDGMVASSQQIASLAGYRALAKGGNAVDSAVAMLATLNVVEPHSSGLGGDAFALIYLAGEDRLVGLNASGRSAYAADLAAPQIKDLKEMPDRGMLTVTVPGALMGWAEAVNRYGRLSLAEVFADAIAYAEIGFPVTEVIAGEWKSVEHILRADQGAAKTYLVEGKSPRPGQVFRNPDLSRSFRLISDQGTEAFYAGELCQRMVDFSQKRGGWLSQRDFIDHNVTWVEPIRADYRGYTVCELPPNGQGLTALQIMNILEGYDISSLGHNSAEYLHLLLEAKKIAFNDRDYYITDPEFTDIPLGGLLSKKYAAKCRGKIDLQKALAPPITSSYVQGSETVYVTAVDKERNAVSFISSVYMFFGSGLVVDGTGIVLQNRGRSFSLDPKHPNRLQPHKRPMHTIIPGMLFKDGRFLMSFGVMGGDMQPQGHAQFLANLIDFKMNLQEALDAPRVRHMQGMDVYLESGISAQAAASLEEKGHYIVKMPGAVNQVGGGQAIYLDADQDVLFGASDRRKDGLAIGY